MWPTRSRRTISSAAACCPVIGTSRAAFTRTRAPTIWPVRCSSSRTHWPVRSISISSVIRSVSDRTERTSFCATSGRRARKFRPSSASTSYRPCSGMCTRR
uniref:Putative secreted protein n=1 Tax=Anopheles triannulatus TaxID=58253 RepID=A0A2M4B3A2_9DIPT